MFAMLTVANCCKKFNFDNGQGHQIQKVAIIMKEKRQRFIFYSTFKIQPNPKISLVISSFLKLNLKETISVSS